MPTCPNDGAELKNNVFGGNHPFKSEATAFINTFTGNTATGYCQKCGEQPFAEAKKKAEAQFKELSSSLNSIVHFIPILSLQAPTDWKFKPLGLVTAQSVTGTGVFSEFASSWTDFFGTQSKAYNQKISGGELICQAQLRLKCVEMGGNAILATDIDYAEVGGGKGMLMVCMTGTAVLLENTEVMGQEILTGLNRVTQSANSYRIMRRFTPILNNGLTDHIDYTHKGM